MQLHEFAGVVLIDVAGRILGIVQVLQHGRMFQRRHHQVTEMAEGMRTDRPLAVVRDQVAHVGLLFEDAEVVQPEPHHLFLQLRRGIDGPQQFAAPCFVHQLVALVVERLPRGLLVGPIRKGVDPLLLGHHFHQQLVAVVVADAQLPDFLGHGVRQAAVFGTQLLRQVALATELAILREHT